LTSSLEMRLSLRRLDRVGYTRGYKMMSRADRRHRLWIALPNSPWTN
jgi:hypothetical protein